MCDVSNDPLTGYSGMAVKKIPLSALIATSLAIQLVMAAGVSSTATARDYTPDLSVFSFDCQGASGCTGRDSAGFRDYVTQLSEALSTQYLGPANSLGYKGFEVTLSTGFTPVDSSMSYWSAPSAGQPGLENNPGTHYYTNQLRIRKGLPHSIQIGGSVTHMYESNLWAIGLDLSWSFVEGYSKAPDVALMVSLGTVLGSSDLLTLHMNAALIISKAFSIAGLFSMEPYVGYNMMFISAGTHMTSAWDSDGYGEPFALGPEYIVRHRMEAGLNFLVENFLIGGTVNADFLSARVFGSIRVGARFW